MIQKLNVEETTGLTIDGKVQQPRNKKGKFTKNKAK